MTHNNGLVNDDYDPDMDLDEFLVELAKIDHVAADEANSFLEATSQQADAITETDITLEAYLDAHPKAAEEVASFMEATDPFAYDKRIMTCLKDGRIDDFKQEFIAALNIPHGSQTVAHLWAHNHLRNERLRHPEVANLLLNLPSFIALLDDKDFLIFVENIVESEGFVPNKHWMVVNARASRLLPGHIVTMLINQRKLGNPITANAFVTCKSLLRRIIDKDWRMRALRLAFLVCDLPPRWADFARRIGLTDADIAELITLRCKHIAEKRYTGTPLPRQDIDFLKMLLMPAGHNGTSYREVLSAEQLSLVVDTIRRGLWNLPVTSTEGGLTFSIQERKILNTLRLETVGGRYRRR